MWHTVTILRQMRKFYLILSTSEHVRYGWHSFIEPILKCSGGHGLSDWLRWFGWDVAKGSNSRVTFIFGSFREFSWSFCGVFVEFLGVSWDFSWIFNFFCWNIFFYFSLSLFYIVDICNKWFLNGFWVPLVLMLRFLMPFTDREVSFSNLSR